MKFKRNMPALEGVSRIPELSIIYRKSGVSESGMAYAIINGEHQENYMGGIQSMDLDRLRADITLFTGNDGEDYSLIQQVKRTLLPSMGIASILLAFNPLLCLLFNGSIDILQTVNLASALILASGFGLYLLRTKIAEMTFTKKEIFIDESSLHEFDSHQFNLFHRLPPKMKNEVFEKFIRIFCDRFDFDSFKKVAEEDGMDSVAMSVAMDVWKNRALYEARIEIYKELLDPLIISNSKMRK